METSQQFQTQTKDDAQERDSQKRSCVNHRGAQNSGAHSYRQWKRCSRVFLYIIFLLIGESAATLLGRFYYEKGGSSKWLVAFVQSAGFPVLLPLYFVLSPSTKSENTPAANCAFMATKPKLVTLILIYLGFGILLAADDIMYSLGLFNLPVSTYSLLCATQLAFNAVFSFFLNKQKCTFFLLNSLVLLTTSASLLAMNADSEGTKNLSKAKYAIGFLCTIGASATFSLHLSLVQLCFQKVIKKETFSIVLDMQLYPSFVATCACVVGLFSSGEWENLKNEMQGYQKGKVSYLMTLVCTAVNWQVSSIGMLGLIFEVSSLFSNIISTLSLPVVPVLAVIFFEDKVTGLKVMALLLSLWGFISYIYQHYRDDSVSKQITQINEDSEDTSTGLFELSQQL